MLGKPGPQKPTASFQSGRKKRTQRNPIRGPRIQCGPSKPPRTRGAISALLEGSPPRLSTAPRVSALLEATPRQEGQTALPLTRPPYGGTKCQALIHSAQDRRRQAAIPHSGCDRSPVRQLRSLLRHPGRCGNTVGKCDVVRDVLGTAPITILPTPDVRTPPHHTSGPRPVPCSGKDPASPRVPQGGMLSTSSRRPGPPPLEGSGTST